MNGPKMFGAYLTGKRREKAIKTMLKKLGQGATLVRVMDGLQRHGRSRTSYYTRRLHVLVRYSDGQLRWMAADTDSAGRMRYWLVYGAKPDAWELAQ